MGKSMSPNSSLLSLSFIATVVALMSGGNATAATVNLNFQKLTNVTGGDPAQTAVFRADLSAINFDINSIQIKDNSSGLGGAAGQFSGFDLDAIKLSTTQINNAADINSLPGLDVFDFTARTIFMPGVQRSPTDPKLFGTTATGNSIDNTVATLGSFDGNSTTNTTFPPPVANGFVSLGDNGKVGFNLTSSVSPSNSLFLYIGEVGDNGEVAAGQIIVSDQPVNVPEPLTILGSATALGFAALFKREHSRKAR
ncbi:hypothetical protein MC7420_5459 [Coleofasciculus chthonoplastes PCC 7420]|uniref:PEP-CTERM exosortase interaction domain protein n=2 Tax=Coleofasciculus chthonoplastes TaxID=64178 RepID=B4VPR1_9CYAN|nr:hypothetical protein MC7420_5459 [Coleofasciculus chthonoplastes PCC 7420]